MGDTSTILRLFRVCGSPVRDTGTIFVGLEAMYLGGEMH